jgi:hypothetical protein
VKTKRNMSKMWYRSRRCGVVDEGVVVEVSFFF